MKSESTDPQSLIDAVLAEYFDCRDRGERFDFDRFAAAHPETADELRDLLAISAYVEGAVRFREESNSPKTNEEFTDASVDESVSTNQDPTDSGANDFDNLDSTVLYSPGAQSESKPTCLSVPVENIRDYELLEELGRGGMGIVYKARQISLNRTVALKMILSGRMASEEELQRFYSEARAVAQLSHPNIVSVYDVREFNGHHFYSMDFIEGCNLNEVAATQSLSEEQIARYMNQIAQAVEYAHQNGILHRDLKPANILIDAEQRPHVTDFGLAKQLEDDSGLTSTGTILGTPSYMSPEQAAGENDELGPTTDVYSMGAILYFLLTGEPPFRGKTAVETVSLVLKEEPRPVRAVNRQVSRSLATICEKCLRKDPSERYQSAQELAVELERFLRGDPIQARPVGMVRRGWFWCRDIPLVAAFIGRSPSTSNRAQVRFQWAVLAVLLLLGFLYTGHRIRSAMLPGEIAIASGEKNRAYAWFSERFAESLQESSGHEVRVIETAGSIENRDLLIGGEAHLGLLQQSEVDSEKVQIVAPLYEEFVHIIVRKNSEFTAICQLNECKVFVGKKGSGNRTAAVKVLELFGITESSAKFFGDDFNRLLDGDPKKSIDAAIVVTGVNNPALKKMILTGRCRLLPIPLRIRDELSVGARFDPATLSTSHYSTPGFVDEENGTLTVSTRALLVVRKGERDSIVRAACQALYKDQFIEGIQGHYSEERIQEMIAPLPMHDAATEFFEARRK